MNEEKVIDSGLDNEILTFRFSVMLRLLHQPVIFKIFKIKLAHKLKHW